MGLMLLLGVFALCVIIGVPVANAKMIMLWLGGMMIPAIDEVTVTLTA